MLLLSKGSKTAVAAAAAAAAAAIRMLLPVSSTSQNPNPNFLSAIAPAPERILLSTTSRLAVPGTLDRKRLRLLRAPPATARLLHSGARGASQGISAMDAEMGTETEGSSLVVVSFYRFAEFPDHAAMRKPLKDLCERVRVSGGIILAPEGINGSICGTRESVEEVLAFIQTDQRLKGLRLVESPVSPEEEALHHGHTSHSPLGAGEDAPFRWDHVRVKVKKEIVSFGDPAVMPTERVGKYVHPRDWNALISDPETVVIDVRNTYETRIGKFKGAVDPSTTAFREFPSWVDDQFQLAKSSNKPTGLNTSSSDTHEQAQRGEKPKKLPRVAMYCTGGIRCEKASSFLLRKGFEEVYHLEGGILKYLEEVPTKESLWEGECFVFDKRVSVEHGLVPGSFKLCYGCKQPVSDADMEAPEWEYGVTCPYCFSSKSEEEKDRARARQRQFETWGIIGGPDKGRRPPNGTQRNDCKEDDQLRNSV